MITDDLQGNDPQCEGQPGTACMPDPAHPCRTGQATGGRWHDGQVPDTAEEAAVEVIGAEYGWAADRVVAAVADWLRAQRGPWTVDADPNVRTARSAAQWAADLIEGGERAEHRRRLEDLQRRINEAKRVREAVDAAFGVDCGAPAPKPLPYRCQVADGRHVINAAGKSVHRALTADGARVSWAARGGLDACPVGGHTYAAGCEMGPGDRWAAFGAPRPAERADGPPAKPCPTCSGPSRETVGMVCQTCGTDYAPLTEREQGWADAWAEVLTFARERASAGPGVVGHVEVVGTRGVDITYSGETNAEGDLLGRMEPIQPWMRRQAEPGAGSTPQEGPVRPL